MLDFQHIEARGLAKIFGATRALHGVDLRLEAGQVTCLLGPNGSGKSTLLSLLSLATRPTRGEIQFGKHSLADAAALRGRIGLLAHASMVYGELNAIENLTLFSALYGITNSQAHIEALRARFELGRFAERPARTYSRGQLQRLALARALVHAPRLLLLDEPSTGLDEASVARLCDAIKEERARGAIIVLVTHERALVDAIADRKVELNAGRVVAGVS